MTDPIDTRAARDRAMGALVGLATGDAVGTTLEFERPGSFPPIDDLVGGGPFGLEPGQWTDDTSMAMCLAESILDTDAMDPADQLRRYVAWWRHGYWSSTERCFDIGMTTRRALARFTDDGSTTPSSIDQDEAANGSLMRLAPVPIRWHADPHETAAMAAASSRPTHPADRPVDACRVYAVLVAALIRGESFDTITEPAFWHFGDVHPQIESIMGGAWKTMQPPAIRGTGFVVDALQAALWAVGGAADFRSAVLRAANLGDDADTTAAIAGQLAGARWGLSGIPSRWRQQVTHSGRIAAIAGELFDRGEPDARVDSWPHDTDFHAYWAEPGQLLAGEYPGDRSQRRARAKLDLLADHGIRTIIDLTADTHLHPYDAELTEVATARQLDITRVHHPIPDMGVIDASGYDAIGASIAAGLERGGVYVHCWGGVGRTATVVGCWLVDHGFDGDAACAEITRLRAATRKAGALAPESPEQTQVIHDRARRTVR